MNGHTTTLSGHFRISSLGILILAVVAIGGWEVGGIVRRWHGAKSSGEAVPVCLIPDEKLHIGEVWEAERFEWHLPVSNTNGNVVTVQFVSTSCNCAQVIPSSLVLKPWETQSIKLLLKLTTPRLSRCLNAESDPKRLAVRLDAVVSASGKSTSTQSWIVDAQIKPLIVWEPGELDCGRHSVLAQSGVLGRVSVHDLLRADAVDVRPISPSFAARIVRKPGANVSRFDVEVRPTGVLPTGEIKSEVILTLHKAGYPSLPQQRIPVRGSVVADVQVSPASILGGMHRVGEQVQQQILLYSMSGRPFVVKKIVAPAGCEVSPAIDVAGVLGRHYQIKHTVMTAGPHNAQVRFLTSLDTDGEVDESATVTVFLHGVSQAEKAR